MQLKSVVLVSAQFSCIAVLTAGTRFTPVSNAAITVLFVSFLLLAWSVMVMLKSKLKIFPEPSPGATLITRGPYRFIRHPMYTAVLMAALATVVQSFSYYRLITFLLLTTILVVKLNFEERLLSTKFAAYKNYAAHTSRLIPFIY